MKLFQHDGMKDTKKELTKDSSCLRGESLHPVACFVAPSLRLSITPTSVVRGTRRRNPAAGLLRAQAQFPGLLLDEVGEVVAHPGGIEGRGRAIVPLVDPGDQLREPSQQRCQALRGPLQEGGHNGGKIVVRSAPDP